MIPTQTEKNHEGDDIDVINKTTVNIRIKELTELLKVTKIPQHRKRIEVDLKSYRAIKKLFDESE